MNWSRRLAVALGLGGNPLRRGTDRLAAAIVLALSTVFAVCAPILAVTAARLTHQDGLAQQRAERSWHQVSAVALQPAAAADQYADQWEDLGVLARWVGPDGIKRVGEVPAPAGLAAGQQVRIWVDGSGAQTPPPLSARQLRTRVTGVAALMVTVLAAVLLLLGRLAHWLLDRRRLADWEAAWALVEPQWNKQR
jgi:hypothetical protein